MTDRSSAASNSELAVRNYLTYLADPSQLVDAADIERLEKEVESAANPLAKLRAYAALERAQATDEGAFRIEFIKYAKQWAAEEGVPAGAFRSMGVPDDVLQAAGLEGGTKRRRGRAKSTKTDAAPRSRRPRVNVDQLEEGILGMSGEFTIKDVVDQVGGSQLTVRSAIDRLEAQGKIAAAGERGGGRGRAARTWRAA